MSVEECQKKWKLLRDHFVRELHSIKKRQSGDAGPPIISHWLFFDTMLFLSDLV